MMKKILIGVGALALLIAAVLYVTCRPDAGSKGTASGIGKMRSARARVCCDRPPNGAFGEATTRWPTATLLTPWPTAVMVPATSIPGVNGSGILYRPIRW